MEALQEDDVIFGDRSVESKTWSEWSISLAPVVNFVMKNGKTLAVRQNSRGYGELGSRVWNACYPLCRFIESEKYLPRWKGKDCIELGSGTGLFGVVAGNLGLKITLTDQGPLIPLIRHNVDTLVEESLRKDVKVTEYLWGSPAVDGFKFDVVFGADLTYDFEDLPCLIDSFKKLTYSYEEGVSRGFQSEIYIAYGKERAAASRFLDACREADFNVEHIPPADIVVEDIENPDYTLDIVKLTRKAAC
mmetsp:Transcript_14230/g.36380  ORF Transcript_14230/g.36380 Transcript_14230/m.36380 type:complete len:247 (-) Transcript_14230:182-922(-)